MPLEFRYENLIVIRVDGDIVEIFTRGGFSHRFLASWLEVRVQPSIRHSLIVKVTSAQNPSNLYEVQPKARPTLGSTVDVVIKAEEEPLFRQFFTQVGHLCGRPVAP